MLHRVPSRKVCLFAQTFQRRHRSLNKALLHWIPYFSLCFLHSLNKGLAFFQHCLSGQVRFQKSQKGLYDTCNPVIRSSLSKRRDFAQIWKKPLWSRLSPAANDVNPVYTVFVNLSLLVKKWCLNWTHMCWFMGVWTYANAEVLSKKLVEVLLAWNEGQTQLTFDNKEGIRRLSLQLAWDERGDTLRRCNISEVLWSTSFSLFLHVCILKGWGFPILCTEKDTTVIFGTFFGLLQTFLMNIISGVKGGVSSLLEAFLLSEGWKLWLEDFCCAGCRKRTFAIQYKLLLLWKEHVGYLLFIMLGLTSLAMISCGCNRKYFILCDSIKRWNDNQKHNCGRVWYVYVEIFWSPLTHIGKPLTVDLLLYMSSTVCRLFSTTITSFPNALTV